MLHDACPSFMALCYAVMSPYPLLESRSVTQMGCCATVRNKRCAGLSQMRTVSAGSPGLFIALQICPIFGNISISIATKCDVRATWFFGENSRKQWPLHKQRSNFHANVSPNVCRHYCSCSASQLSHCYLAGSHLSYPLLAGS